MAALREEQGKDDDNNKLIYEDYDSLAKGGSMDLQPKREITITI